MQALIPLLAVVFGVAASHAPANADEWSVVPVGDPIYRQLGVIDQFGDGKTTKATKGLTRYEAALEVARVITFSGSDNTTLPRAGWRALSELCQSLRPELTQLGIDVNTAIATCAKNIALPSMTTDAKTVGSLASKSSIGLGNQTNAFQDLTGMRSPLLSSGTTQNNAALGITGSSFQLALSPRLRFDASTLTLGNKQNRNGLGNNNAVTSPYVYGNSSTQMLGSSVDVAYALNPYLTLRAGSTQRELLGDPSQSPLFNASFFNGASQARSSGGGINVNLGRLSLSGDVETLGTDTGERGTLVGGGVGLTPWDRLSLSAKLSYLRSEEDSSQASTGTEFGLGLDVTRRLRLNVLYQSLFSQQSTNNASRVSGGLSMSF